MQKDESIAEGVVMFYYPNSVVLHNAAHTTQKADDYPYY